jgi:hypothetical protein
LHLKLKNIKQHNQNTIYRFIKPFAISPTTNIEMSSNNDEILVEENTPVMEVEKKPKKPRSPTLPMKYHRYRVFTHWLVRSLIQELELDEENVINVMEERLRMYVSVDEQKEFYKDFDDNVFKNEKKDIVKKITSHNRKAKATNTTKKSRTRKSSESKNKKKSKMVVETNEPKETLMEVAVRLINEAVHAETETAETGVVTNPLTPEKTEPSEPASAPSAPKKSKKTEPPKLKRVPTLVLPTVDETNIINDNANTLPPPPLARKEEKETPAPAPPAEDEETTIDTIVVNIGGVEYFVNEQTNEIYNENSELLGNYCSKTNSIKPIKKTKKSANKK